MRDLDAAHPAAGGVSARTAARLAEVSRALPLELHRLGLISAAPLALADVLSLKVIGCIPTRWTRPKEVASVDEPPVDIGALAREIHGKVHLTGIPSREFLVVQPHRFDFLESTPAAATVFSSNAASLVLPVGLWFHDLSASMGVPELAGGQP